MEIKENKCLLCGEDTTFGFIYYNEIKPICTKCIEFIKEFEVSMDNKMKPKLTYEEFVIDGYESLQNNFIERNIELFAAYCQEVYDKTMKKEDSE